MNLTQKTCQPCEGGVKPFDREEAQRYLEMLAGDWKLSEDGRVIGRRMQFKDFKETMAFVNRVAELAEQEGHHPDMTILYNKLKIGLSTHVIDGLSENDFILAAKIDRLVKG